MGRQPVGTDGMKCSSLRRGAWSGEEDVLLRQCIEKYGEGNWHKVPTRAGLNRCRKSCRLRWLNYLHPGIKRGEFQEDEVDLIKKLHKLLGNRWSLIAGRIPGRTANDIKNYWNTHFKEKLPLPSTDIVFPGHLVKAIRPQPRSFLSNATASKHFMSEKNVGQLEQESNVQSEKSSAAKAPSKHLPMKMAEEAEPSSWAGELEQLMKMSTNDQHIRTLPLVPGSPAEGLTEKLNEDSNSPCWKLEESLFNVDDLLGGDGDIWKYLL